MPVEQASTAVNSIPFTFWSVVISAVVGLITGTIASLVSPWVHYYIELRKKAIEFKIERLAEVRNMLDRSETMADVKKSSLWGFIDDNLNEQERNAAMSVRTVIIQADDGSEISQQDIKKQAISKMLSRLEKEWNLTKSHNK